MFLNAGSKEQEIGFQAIKEFAYFALGKVKVVIRNKLLVRIFMLADFFWKSSPIGLNFQGMCLVVLCSGFNPGMGPNFPPSMSVYKISLCPDNASEKADFLSSCALTSYWRQFLSGAPTSQHSAGEKKETKQKTSKNCQLDVVFLTANAKSK